MPALKRGHGVPNLPEGGLAIFTDGSMLSSPRRGGYGFRLVWEAKDGGELSEDVPGVGWSNARINQMEIKAFVEALKYVQQPYMRFELRDMSKIVIFTDSTYVAENFMRARYEWKPSWCNRDGRPVGNAEEWREFVKQWEKLERLGLRLRVEFAKGHNKRNPHNKAADGLAKSAAKSASRAQLRPTSPGRKLTKALTVRGCIPMQEQEMTIRIIGHETSRLTRVTTYRYEVVDADSPHDALSDVISSTEIMHRHHSYRVRVNDDPKNPWVAELLSEVDLGLDDKRE
jgi:ribonuclease HI